MLLPAMTSVPSRSAMPPSKARHEAERIELEENVVAQEAVNIETCRTRVELSTRAKLDRVRGDREIRLHFQTWIIVGEQADPDSRHVAKAVRQRRNRRNIAEVRMKAANTEREGLASPHETRSAMLPVIE